MLIGRKLIVRARATYLITQILFLNFGKDFKTNFIKF